MLWNFWGLLVTIGTCGSLYYVISAMPPVVQVGGQLDLTRNQLAAAVTTVGGLLMFLTGALTYILYAIALGVIGVLGHAVLHHRNKSDTVFAEQVKDSNV
eukprot:TRINITY_DN12693_c0_g1_i11.p2 TRINITY_DN12693_c0_g1~~TRINITY_DN12693_c0_g1_i11.p2  ORF type:complete len:100 (+),score=19.97 TRINITY_DN12693_c0_g1_i11:212-511(+)